MKNIDQIKDYISEELGKYGIDEKNIIRAVYASEEIILLYNADIELVKCEVVRNSSDLSIKLTIPGDNYTIRQLEEGNDLYIFDNIIKKTNFFVSQEYNNNNNEITLTIEKYFNIINNIKFAFKYVDTNKKELFWGYTYNIIAIIVNIFIPLFTGKLILAYTNDVYVQAVTMAFAIFVSRIAYLFFISKSTICYNVVSFDLSNVLQTTLLSKLFSLSDAALEKNGSGQFARRINNDVDEIAGDVVKLFNMISRAFYYLGVLIASLLYDKVVFVAELITFVGLYFLENKRVKLLDVNRRKVLNAQEKHSSVVLEEIYGATEIKLLNASEFFIAKTKKSADEVAEVSKKANKEKTIFSFFNNSYIYFCYLIIMVYLGYAINHKTMSIPDALILFNFFTIISTPLVSLVQSFMNFKKTFSIACERYYNLLEGNEFTKEINGKIYLDNVKGKIEFKNVDFAYETEPNEKSVKILNNISFIIKPGTTNAIVGKSGEGKTTILKLISGQRTPNIGTIEIDGLDISKIDKLSLRDNMAIISQTPFFFNASIKDNLLLAKPDATEEEIIKACKNAYIYDDIIASEHGFDTILNEKGVRFSGGQRQRLAIARAILKNSKIIIFDEATSALDNITQAKIMKAIKKIDKTHTVILVAHRLTSIIHSDNILMINKGKIACQGTHAELLKINKDYQKIYGAE